jgi:hypothetical protein
MLESSIPTPSTVRSEVLGQHEVVRDLLQRAVDTSAATLESRADAAAEQRAHVVHLAYEIRRRVRTHLAFEERLLIPVLSSADSWGPERARNLVEEHMRQREQLDDLVQGVEQGWDRTRLAGALGNLAADFLRDMQEEERDYLQEDMLRDDAVAVDQATD